MNVADLVVFFVEMGDAMMRLAGLVAGGIVGQLIYQRYWVTPRHRRELAKVWGAGFLTGSMAQTTANRHGAVITVEHPAFPVDSRPVPHAIVIGPEGNGSLDVDTMVRTMAMDTGLSDVRITAAAVFQPKT